MLQRPQLLTYLFFPPNLEKSKYPELYSSKYNINGCVSRYTAPYKNSLLDPYPVGLETPCGTFRAPVTLSGPRKDFGVPCNARDPYDLFYVYKVYNLVNFFSPYVYT